MKLLILGFGNVGRAFCQLLPPTFIVSACTRKGGVTDVSADFLSQAALQNKPLTALDGFVSMNPQEAVEEWEYDVLVDLTPTNLENAEPSKTYWMIAFDRGKSVVSANKGPLALSYSDMHEAAEGNNTSLLFEATVAGGTPVFNFVRHCLNGSELMKVEGILNGTTNYILSKMQSGMAFSEALVEAQAKGYAEADPSYDVQGKDALAKAVILANALFDNHVSFKNLQPKGIEAITREMVNEAEKQNECFKLIASVDGERVSVAPQRISFTHPLAKVGDVWNALTFHTRHADAITLYGKGAGGFATASAVLNDVLELYDYRA